MQTDNSLITNKEQIMYPTIMEGSTGNYVIILQDKLKKAGYYDLSITGSFDDYTKKATVSFQKDYTLFPNGIVNNETWQTLYELTNKPKMLVYEEETRPTLRLGSTGSYVKELQTLLTNLLYYSDTIDGIFGASTQTAVKAFQLNNRLTTDGIVGRDTWSALLTLYSPMAICNGNGENNVTYTVVAGDSLWVIARRFGTTVDAIKRLNNLTSDLLQIGQKLLIPVSNESTPPKNYITYTVISGDSLWNLARRFNTNVDAIKKLNNLTSDRLSIGQILKIPTNNQSPIIYTVVAGDSLWLIARRFNTTVDAIKKLNNLTSDLLQIGQKLFIL